ncbi:MAG: HpcH/HpaI aldolase family protein [Sagittula sp.]|jgi:4-hydroxy-2-oxoheptanedioate aldolase|uniref:HpcH/HpaI aldolase family protein n=1 Tax=unclassified Sagittula TaxID=2624628 RepID=UPI000C2D226B|nr:MULTISPECIES: aldolase/citrate lyase family protein [unclassified Sagittula]AUC56748.1 aldolase [Sagittula sp. P11]WHZ37854.1 aldolase/citrate lyase family protein [Sagittula sp. MA-2]
MNSLKTRLLEGEFITAAWAELGCPDIAEILVRHGWPVVLIDGEHGIGDLETWVSVARAVEAAGGEVILRVPEGTDTMLKKVLDRGFRSIVVPMVNTVEQAQQIARSCHYPVRGTGGIGRGYAAPIVRGSDYGTRPDYASRTANEDVLVFVQCETPESVSALAEIAGVEGIDGIFLGPNDLAATLGHIEDMDHATPQAAFAEVEAKVLGAGKLLATVPGGGRDFATLRQKGFGLVAGVNDISVLVEGIRTSAAARDAELGRNVVDATAAAPRRY